MQVLKFGGSSVANSDSIKRICYLLKKKPKGRYAIVVSALENITDQLIQCGKLAYERKNTYKNTLEKIKIRHLNIIRDLFPLSYQSDMIGYIKKNIKYLENLCHGIFQVKELSKRSLDKIMSFGELTSSFIITEKLKQYGLNAVCKDSRELIVTDSQFGCAKVDFRTSNHHIIQFFREKTSEYIVFPGFIGSTSEHETTTLGRGGSDYTAAILASAISANLLEIWTDVSGMMTANPKFVDQAFPIKKISYEEAMELSNFGAKVIYPPTIHPAMRKKIPIQIKNTFSPTDPGTLIHIEKKKTNISQQEPVTGISGIQNLAFITLEGNKGIGVISGYSKRLFEALSREKINIIFITQSSSEYSITTGIHEMDIIKAQSIIDSEFSLEIHQGIMDPLKIEKNLCIISIVGDNMKNLHGTSGKMFSSLGKNGINVIAIAQESTEKNISAVIRKNDFKKALNTLHETFFEKYPKQINLFICGVGKVGSKLIEQIDQQKNYLLEKLKLKVRIIGLANSQKMYFDGKGINLCKWRLILNENGIRMNVYSFMEEICKFNLRNSLFVDNTASEEMAMTYEKFFQNGIGVITCNKIACSSDYNHYKRLKTLSKHFRSPFLFETNVGSSIPVISTINDLINGGDKIKKIEAVLSGSLNFIFNHFIGEKSFLEVVKEAQYKGYTKPDPRIDLSGLDVMRKILILARECGSPLELSDIGHKSFLPKSCSNAISIENFYQELHRYRDYFSVIRKESERKKKRLRFIARYENGRASIGLESVKPTHPFYQLEGKDNMVVYNTSRYDEHPLIIKGSGDGADVIASGVLSDIIKATK
ncbi:MAG: bifunctional aspartate kinase/homoserine dehydrogenase I [Flavobacteriales bacterium]|jgi:aspartokinase/homoserine dehydrogenase 1|uniref:bifunctional aspartate kinase/homoserine dehydrogenase I n=1 Tax=Blattabacterium sp. (Mastotermes darwiniensis) TaxID=39768 RepID=UPI000231DDE6|nr:bifunctional aspartate kinase/homoserine dehydrogenase I [Blattabacterium sp. (Mastotermes darwiniensis)]AER40538.1 aspartokinase/homoserine dehydrogenase [Blattabacterium sp. (Mastotermes darwiniensis) str. MADAR]MDR1804948.1 bifunctional aspartate kinase/homoserine dehydrogenase I [Flavobacteriales bacterium]